MHKYEPGFYAAEVKEFMLDVDNDDPAQPVFCFRVVMDKYPEAEAWCYHKAYGADMKGKPRREKCEAIVTSLGGTITDLDTFDPTGKRCTVSVMHNEFNGKTYENCYISLGGGKRGTAETKTVTAAMSQLTGKVLGEGLPF